MSLKIVKFDTKMYLNFSIFGDEPRLGGRQALVQNGDKCRLGGGIDQIFAGWEGPTSSPEKKTLVVLQCLKAYIIHLYDL